MLRGSFALQRLTLVTILSLILSSATSWATTASFQRKSTVTQNDAMGVVTADLNGDGIPDLIESNVSTACNCIAVQLGKGDGTFAPPVLYTFPFLNQGFTMLATADVNNDGKADVIVRQFTVANNMVSTHILVYLGNGDGTLAAPTDFSFIGGGDNILAADVDGDGNVDLVLATTNGEFSPTQSSIAVMRGDGHGNFAAPVTVFGPDSTGATPVAVGDFDADGHADIALRLTHGTCTNGGCSSDTIGILYGDGAGNFTEADVFTAAGDFVSVSSGDLDQNGTTDLMLVLDTPTSSGQDVAVLYGDNRAHSVSPVFLTSKIPLHQSRLFSSLPVSDFNGDLTNDFAILGVDSATNQVALDVFLRSASGAFTQQEVPFSSGIGDIGDLVVGDFNRDRKPDLLFGSTTASTAANPSTVTDVNDFLNTTSSGHFDSCSLPASSRGIHVCRPGSGATVTSPVRLTAAANWFQTLRKLEVWIDGAKVGEEHFGWDKSAWFELTRQLATGSHTATFFSAGYDNLLQKKSVTFTVSGTQSCSHPSTVGIHVCSPVNKSIDSSPVLAQAAATVSGTIARMEVWVDGVKKFTASGTTTLKTSLSLPSGSHKFTFYAINTAGTKISSSVTINVQ